MHLFLFVKVRENWGDDPERYREMGLEFPRGSSNHPRASALISRQFSVKFKAFIL